MTHGCIFFNSKGLQLRNHNIKVLIKLVNQRKKLRLSIDISMQNIFMDFWIWLNKGNVTLTENVQFLTKHAHHLNETLSVWSECIKVNSNVIIQCKPIKYKLKRCANATNKTFTKIQEQTVFKVLRYSFCVYKLTKNYLFLYLHLFHSFLLFFFFRNCWCNSSGVPVILFSLSITLGRHVFIWFLHCSNFPWEVFFIPVPLSSLSFICIKFVNSMICIATFSDEPVSNDISFSLEKVFFFIKWINKWSGKKNMYYMISFIYWWIQFFFMYQDNE